MKNKIYPEDCKWYRISGKFRCRMYGGATMRPLCKQRAIGEKHAEYVCPDFTPHKKKEK